MRLPLVQYWQDLAVPSEIEAALHSFEEANPGLEQRVFDESAAERLIAACCGAREAAAFRACAIPAMQADYFRYCAIHALGGIYADANYRCMENVEGLIAGPADAVLFGRQDPVPRRVAEMCNWPYPVGSFRTVADNMFACKRPRHPLLELAIEVATANVENRVADGPVGVWLSTGPGVFTSMYLLRELGSFDAFIEYSIGSVIEPSAPLFCELVGDLARVEGIFDGVVIRPAVQKDSMVTKVRRAPGAGHWSTVRHSIYR